MSRELPTPRQLALRLASVGLGIVFLQAASFLAFLAVGKIGAPGLAEAAPGVALWFVVAPLTIPVIAVLLVTAQTLARVTPLYRVARHGALTHEVLPPSPTALRDAVEAPRRMKALIAGAWVAALLFLPWTLGFDPSMLAAPIFAAGILAAGAAPFSLGIRYALRPWITAFPPAEVAAVAAMPYSRVAAFHGAMVVASVGLIATALALPAGADLVLALAVGLTSTVGLALGARWLCLGAAGAMENDVEALRQRVRRAAETPGMQLVATLPRPVAGAASDALVVGVEAELDRVIEGLRDRVDEERQVKTTIEESQAQKTIFMASMSHDLRSPLNSIMGFSELLVSGIGGDLTEGQRENVAVIQRSGSELLELLNDIIDTARLDAGRLPLRREWTPTVALLGEATRKGREMVALRTGIGDGFTIEEELEPGLPPLHIDRMRIVQALLCLFRHATRAMEGGAIRLSARSAGGAVRVAVTDSGASVQDEDRQRVFDAFRSITSVSGHRIGGMGLALSLARSLVRAHGGDVHYDASAREGTTIVLSIPTTGPDPKGQREQQDQRDQPDLQNRQTPGARE